MEAKKFLSVIKIKLVFFNTPERIDKIIEQMNIDGAIEEKYIVPDYYLQENWLTLVTI